MPAPLRLRGIAASPGFAEGPIFPISETIGRYEQKKGAEAEREALRRAIAEASSRLEGLMSRATDESAEMLEFQLAMLADDTLTEPAYAAISGGAAADIAWSRALDAECAGYESSDNEYFRARAADLTDIRDQVLASLSGSLREVAPAGSIVYGHDITPTRFLETDWSQGGGIALTAGSAASHVAMLARARGIPMVVALPAPKSVPAGIALLDGLEGGFVVSPSVSDLEQYRVRAQKLSEVRREAAKYLAAAAATCDGTAVRVLVNVADPSDVNAIDIAWCDGVGLMRTEFLYGRQGGLPDEETQYEAYRQVLEWAGGKPVTIRTVDAGGDKPVAGLTVEETNPFLGLRGIRLTLARPEIFRVQVRALLRASNHGSLKVMFPMVSDPEEYDRAAAFFHSEAASLSKEGAPHSVPPLGIMVEVPAVAITPERFAHAAFFSIGSNDLTQYVMAAARDNPSVAGLNDVRNPAVLKLVAGLAMFGASNAVPVSLCGDAGGDPSAIPDLLQAGLRDLSVAPAQLAMAKAAIAGVSL